MYYKKKEMVVKCHLRDRYGDELLIFPDSKFLGVACTL